MILWSSELVVLILLDSAARAANNKHIVSEVAVYISLYTHIFDDCLDLLRKGPRFAGWDWDALLGVTTTMSIMPLHTSCGPCGNDLVRAK